MKIFEVLQTSLLEDVKSAMAEIMSLDKMIIGYQLQGNALIVTVNNNRPITDLAHYGYNDQYKRDIMRATGVQNVVFKPAVANTQPASAARTAKGNAIFK